MKEFNFIEDLFPCKERKTHKGNRDSEENTEKEKTFELKASTNPPRYG